MFRLSTRNATRAIALASVGSLIGFGAIGASAIGASATGAAAAKRAPLGHNATAYGSSVELSSVFTSGPSALATLGCTSKGGVDHQNSAASGGLLAAGTLGAINDEVTTESNSSTATSTIASAGLFSNLITVDAFSSTATASSDGSSFATSGGTTFLNLSINGSPVSAPAPNTVIPLGSFGTVTVNEQISKVTSKSATMIVNAFHVHITAANEFNFAIGTDIVVGHSRAGLDQKETPFLDGHAYGTSITGLGAASGRTAVVHLACQGTDGDVRENTVAGTAIPNVISTGTITSTGDGVASKGFASGETADTIQNVSLLGIISVDQVKAHASADLSGKTRTFSDTGSSFTNISVLGIPTLPDPVPPNSQYAIPNVGTLYLHRVLETGHHIEVRMIELVVSVPVGPISAGTDIRIGVASAGVH